MSAVFIGWPLDVLGMTRDRRITSAASSSAAVQRRRGILIAGNLALELIVLKVELEVYDCSVILARDGGEAVELFERHEKTIDLVLLNAQLTGSGGAETLARIQRINGHVRFCFMASCGNSYNKMDSLALGLERVFEKPFNPATVARTLYEILEAGNGRLGEADGFDNECMGQTTSA